MTASTGDTSTGETAATESTGGSKMAVDLRKLERPLSRVIGGALLLRGLRRRSLGGVASAIVGGALLYHGISDRTRRSRSSESADETGDEAEDETDGVTVQRSITIRKSPDELSDLWTDPEQVSRIFGSFAEVTDAGGDRYRWEVDGPLGRAVSWEMETVSDRPGESHRWQSVDETVIPNEWTVRFRPAPREDETEVTLTLEIDPPGGTVGRTLVAPFVPGTLLGEVLNRFKSLAETGQIPTQEGNVSARGTGDLV